MPVVRASLQGRFGNQCCQWLFAKSIAERTGSVFRCDDWIGNKIFKPTPHCFSQDIPRVNEHELIQWSLLPYDKRHDVEFRGYAQMQQCMTYTKKQAQEWLKISDDLLPVLNRILANRTPLVPDTIVAHQRAGDYAGYGYPIVSKQSYRDAAVKYFGSCAHVNFVTEENPLLHAPLPDELAFLPDFYRLMQAPVLMRGNSTFSFVAGLLGNGLVLSPRIDGLVGGVEHDGVQFEAGNHCRLANLDFCSDLHVVP